MAMSDEEAKRRIDMHEGRVREVAPLLAERQQKITGAVEERQLREKCISWALAAHNHHPVDVWMLARSFYTFMKSDWPGLDHVPPSER